MKIIDVAQLGKQGLALIRQLASGEILIVQNENPVAKLVAFSGHGRWIGCLRDQLRINGDIFSTQKNKNAES